MATMLDGLRWKPLWTTHLGCIKGCLCDEGKGPKPWKEVGASEIGVLEIYSLARTDPADDARTVGEGIAFALEHAEGPAKWIFPKYSAGPAGFEAWAWALDSGQAHSHGAAYNAAVWSECRRFGSKFLEEAKGRLKGCLDSHFDEGRAAYEEGASKLGAVSELFPFPPKGDEVKDSDRCASAAALLREAKEAERRGLAALRAIRDRL